MAMKDNLLVTGGRDLKVKAWDLVSGEVLFTLSGDHRIMITSVQFKDDYLVSASLDGTQPSTRLRVHLANCLFVIGK